MKNNKKIADVLKIIPAPIYRPEEDMTYISEADYYGASSLIAGSLNFKNVPYSNAGWRHAWIHTPLKYVEQLIVWGRRDSHYLTGTKHQADFLNQHGIDATPVGLPFIYGNDIDPSIKVENSLLVMPPHTLPYIKSPGGEENYIKEIEMIRDDFYSVYFCIHPSCIKNGIWPKLLEKYNYPFIIGASADQINAINRLQKIFSIFEFVTSNIIGSHIPYAAYCGAKVSLYGSYLNPYNYDLKNDPFSRSFPSVMEHHVAHTTKENIIEKFPFLFHQHPRSANQSINWAKKELGRENKKQPIEVAKKLGWEDIDYQNKMTIKSSTIKTNIAKEKTLASIASVINETKNHGGNFAIYGAGKIGLHVLNALNICDLHPVCFFDQKYTELDFIGGIKVKNPAEIEFMAIDLIIIASFSYKDEIKIMLKSSTSVKKIIEIN